MSKLQKIWVVVSDGVHAQVYDVKSVRPLRVAALTAGHFHGRKEAAPHTHCDGAAATFPGDGGARHHVGRHPDHHRVDKEIFAEHLGDYINAAGRVHEFDRLVLVAPNRALGDLRRALDHDVQQKIKVEVDGEWTKLSQVDLEKHLADHVPGAEATL